MNDNENAPSLLEDTFSHPPVRQATFDRGDPRPAGLRTRYVSIVAAKNWKNLALVEHEKPNYSGEDYKVSHLSKRDIRAFAPVLRRLIEEAEAEAK